MKETELVRHGWPDPRQDTRVESCAIGHYLVGVDAGLFEAREKRLDHRRVNTAMYQLVAHKPIPLRCCGINRQQ
jgi:hypothetical protein